MSRTTKTKKPFGREVHVDGMAWSWRADRGGVRIVDPSGVLSVRVHRAAWSGWPGDEDGPVTPSAVKEFIQSRVLPSCTSVRGVLAWKPPVLSLMDRDGVLVHREPLRAMAHGTAGRMRQTVRQAEKAWRPGVFRAQVDPGSEPPLPDRLAFDQRGRAEVLRPWQRWEDVAPRPGARPMEDEEERLLERQAQAGDQAAAERLGRST